MHLDVNFTNCALMRKLLSGEVRVKDAEKFVKEVARWQK